MFGRKTNKGHAKQGESKHEDGARKAMLEDMFNDYYRNRHKVYLMNFVRGIFFGLGSVLGGTIVVALLIWVLIHLGNAVPPLHNFFQNIAQPLQQTKG